MTTITIKIDERKKAGKTFLELLQLFQAQKNVVQIVEEKEKSPYNPEFVKKIQKARTEKGGRIVNPKNIWEGLQ